MDSLLCKLSMVRADGKVAEFSPLILKEARGNHQIDGSSADKEEPASAAEHLEGPQALPAKRPAGVQNRKAAQAAADAAYQRRHAFLVQMGLRYVDTPCGPLTALTDGCIEAKGRLRHGMPVRLLAVSGGQSKVCYKRQPEGVWIPSSFLDTKPPMRLAQAKSAQPSRTSAELKARPAAPAPALSELEVDPALLPEDAPLDHIAHIRVKYNGTHQNPLVSFRFDGVPFQTTVGAAGSRHAAEVIARACWLRFEQGDTKEEVTRFRNDCYARLDSRPAAKRPRVEAAAPDVPGPETAPALPATADRESGAAAENRAGMAK